MGAASSNELSKQLDFEVDRAAELVREAGLTPEIGVRADDASREVIREAEAIGADDVFYVHKRSRLRRRAQPQAPG